LVLLRVTSRFPDWFLSHDRDIAASSLQARDTNATVLEEPGVTNENGIQPAHLLHLVGRHSGAPV
jgi:hypothetical protein